MRLISRQCQGSNLIKVFSWVRVVGAPEDYARRYYKNGVDSDSCVAVCMVVTMPLTL